MADASNSPPALEADGALLSEAADPAAARRPPADFSGAFEDFTPEDAAPGAPPSAQALAARLPLISFGDEAFLLASKRAAFSFALDLIRNRQRVAGRPKRSRLIVCAGPAAASAVVVPDGLDADVEIWRMDDPDSVEAQITPRTAGFLIEPFRPDAGLEAVSGEFLASLRQAADDYGLALVFDESFCGLGRSGMMWAHEWTGVTPDLLICGEGLAGPHPLAALIATQKYARGAAAPALDVGPNVLAAADAKLDALLSPGFLERVQNRSWRLEDQLALIAHKRPGLFRGFRGLGLMQGLLCAGEAGPIGARLAEQGLAARCAGDVLGLIAPLCVEEEDIDAAAAVIAAAAAAGFDQASP